MPEARVAVTTYDREVLSEAQEHVVSLVGHGQKVLEMGANTGYVSRAMRGNGCHVTATDFDRQALPRLVAATDEAIWCDLNRLETLAPLENRAYDVIVFGDVLEHLTSPDAALEWSVAHLLPGGRVVVSLPNIAHWTIRVLLARGKFPMGPWGILDRTHLRFFTVESAEEFFATHGLGIQTRRYAVDPVAGMPWDRLMRGRALHVSRRLAPRVVTRWPAVFAYQIVWELAPVEQG